MESLQGRVYPDFGCTTALQIRFADLEVSQQDCIDAAAATAAATTVPAGEISSRESGGGASRPTLNTNNLSLGNLNISSDLAGTGLRFNPCYVNPEPVCVSTTAHVIVPGCSIIEGDDLISEIFHLHFLLVTVFVLYSDRVSSFFTLSPLTSVVYSLLLTFCAVLFCTVRSAEVFGIPLLCF